MSILCQNEENPVKFNEAQKAVLSDFDEGKHAHLVNSDPRSFNAVSLSDPPTNFMLSHLSANKGACELSAASAAIEEIQQEIRSRTA